ncbi:uncharacterized protein A4U43_C02F12890 [Asparagus officinalis]|uniref:Protein DETOXIFICATION n=1 Tax=Asparagus officinalis TaxID=4686 RepID=A0A5P1FHW4_ASPOF|nr:protein DETOXIFICATION 21-like [Asparagus officinalis]XP_020253634.1 protein DETOXIFICATION 21-like [Asparagus officinalis]ONK77975.1 uncharacterized protein A4U43_C02F12890 [Asparagus officinalis]
MGDDNLSAKLLHSREREEQGENNEEINLREKLADENKKLWVVAAPSIFTRFSTFGVSVISQAFIGHIGPTELAAYALVGTVVLRLANGLLLGMASALETLCGQSFGAKQYYMLGVYLQRSWIILFITTLVILPLFIFSTPLLILLGQDEEVAKMAGVISKWFIPFVFSYMWSFSLQMYLQAQSKNQIISYLAFLTLVIHVSLSWLLTVKLGLGLAGVMSSMIVAMWIPVLGQLGFVFFGGCPQTWTGFSSSAFKDLGSMMKISLSSGVMLCLEFWYNTILVLLTGHMRNAEVALDALSICLNINGWEMMISFGFMAAAGVRVANELGAGNAKRAKFAIVNVVLQSLIIGTVLFVLFLLFRGRVAYIFTDSLKVVKAVADLSPLLAFSILLNSVQPVLSGVAIGSGWQGIVAYVNITCYYIIGIPVGIVLGYALDLHVKGIWIGMLLGTAIQTLVLVCITIKTDWTKQVAVARERVSKWRMPRTNGSENDRQQLA